MGAPLAAANLAECLEYVPQNVHAQYEAFENLKTKMTEWRTTFFDLLDRSDPNQERIYQWIVPTIAVEKALPSDFQAWYLLNRIVVVLGGPLAALRFDGYTPPPALEADIIAAFNTVWGP